MTNPCDPKDLSGQVRRLLRQRVSAHGAFCFSLISNRSHDTLFSDGRPGSKIVARYSTGAAALVARFACN